MTTDNKIINNTETKIQAQKRPRPISFGMEAIIYNQKAEEDGKISLPVKVFGVAWNADLVHQVVIGQNSNKRVGTAHTKDRSEVRGGGRKPWKQKGTGQARHGSSRSPIWIGGGVTHGPRKQKNYTKKINKKMSAKALFAVLTKKHKEGEIFFVDDINFGEIKTKGAMQVLSSFEKKIKTLKGISTAKKPKLSIAMFGRNDKMYRSFKNIPSVVLTDVKSLNPVDALNSRNLIILKPEESLKFLMNRIGK